MLVPERVNEVFEKCLPDRDNSEKSSEIKGFAENAIFSLENLEENRHEIALMLNELPVQFRQYCGGQGASFSDAFKDKYGSAWTENAQDVDRLFLLGQGIGCAELICPHGQWPEGVPYYCVIC